MGDAAIMIEFQQKRVTTHAGKDRLSSLPNNLIDSILERVPIRDAVRTSVLSTKWRYVWTKLPALVFDEHFSKNIIKHGAFCRIVNRVLLHHNGPIMKFNIHVPETHFDMYNDINQWMSFLCRHGVKKLTLTSASLKRYGLPSYVFSCSQLTMLKVENFFFKAPATFGGFSSLKTLYLKFVHFSPSGAVGNFPNLQELSLYMCNGVNNFQINATKLSYLSVFDFQNTMLPLLAKNKCLTDVIIVCCTPVEPSDPEIYLGKLLCNLKELRYLVLGGHLLKFLSAEQIPDRFLNEFNHLNDLRLSTVQFSDMNHVRFILCLLRSSPNLRDLTIFQYQEIMEHQPIMEHQHDNEQTVSLLEEPNCLEQSLNQLHTLFLKEIVGSRTELLFIKLILAHSPSLRSLSFKPRRASEAEIRFRIMKDVMRFPRASPNAEIIYLDPES